jgi:hypothetical protein
VSKRGDSMQVVKFDDNEYAESMLKEKFTGKLCSSRNYSSTYGRSKSSFNQAKKKVPSKLAEHATVFSGSAVESGVDFQ